MTYGHRTRPDPSNVFAAALALVLVLILFLVSTTLRARYNVMQVVSVSFVLCIVVRGWKAGQSPADTSQKTQPVRIPWLGLAAGTAAWSLSLAVGFISDDFIHLYRARGDLLPQLWSLLIEGQENTFMRPVGFASIFLDHALWGQSAAGYHVTNLALHLAGVAAFYALNRELGSSRNHAIFLAGLYICMPIQVEAVAWMGARFDLLSNALTLWAAVFYLRYRAEGRLPMYAAALCLYLLATFSKENGFVLPLLILSIELLMFSPRRVWAPLGLLGAGILSFAYRWYALKGVGGYSSGGKLSAFDIGPKTFEGLFLRGPTQLFSGFNWSQPPEWAVILLGSLTGTTLLLISFKASPTAQTWRYIKLGLAWALISMAPAHFLLMVGGALTNSRVFYMASAGAALVLGHLILAVPTQKARVTATIALTFLMSLGTVHNTAAWLSASRASSQVISDVVRLEPSPPPGTEFVFANLPLTQRGVFFFQLGLTEGLRMAYRRDDLTARRDEDQPSPSKHRIHLRWTGDYGQLIEKRLDK